MKNIRHLLTLFFLIAIVGSFLIRSESLNRTEIWFSNVDQDSNLLTDSLRVNAGREPTFIEHPGLGNYILYGAGLKVLKTLGTIKVANIDELFATDDPILHLPGLYYGVRHISQVLALLTALALGICIFMLGRGFFAATIAGALVLSSYGLLLQSLMVRTELASVFFVSFAILCLCAVTKTKNFLYASILCMFSGLALGLGVLSKVVVIPLLGAGLLFVAAISIQRWKSPGTSSPTAQSSVFLMITGTMLFLSYYFFRTLGFNIIEGTLIQPLITFLTILYLFNFIFLQRMPKVYALLNYATALIGGLLIAIPIVFYLCNLHSLWVKKVVILNAFSLKLFNCFALTYHAGYFPLLRSFWYFLDYSCFHSGLLLAIPFGLLIADKKGRLGAILLTCCGLGMCLVMSSRYFGHHYVIYPDFFYSAALAVCLIYRNQEHLFLRYLAGKYSIISCVVVAGLVILFGVMQYEYAKKSYPKYNEGLRNQLQFVPSAFQSPELTRKMLARYKSFNECMWRVIRDDRLNGSERGIKIRGLANVNDSLRCIGGPLEEQRQEAQDMLTSGLATEEEKAAAHYDLGEAYEANNQIARAIREYRLAADGGIDGALAAIERLSAIEGGKYRGEWGCPKPDASEAYDVKMLEDFEGRKEPVFSQWGPNNAKHTALTHAIEKENVYRGNQAERLAVRYAGYEEGKTLEYWMLGVNVPLTRATHISWMTRGTCGVGMAMVVKFAGEHYEMMWNNGSDLDRKYQLEEWRAGDLDWQVYVSEDVYTWAKKTAEKNKWSMNGAWIVRVGLDAMSLHQNDVAIDNVQAWFKIDLVARKKATAEKILASGSTSTEEKARARRDLDELGAAYEADGQMEQAIKEYRLAADRGASGASAALDRLCSIEGGKYRWERGCPKPDAREAYDIKMLEDFEGRKEPAFSRWGPNNAKHAALTHVLDTKNMYRGRQAERLAVRYAGYEEGKTTEYWMLAVNVPLTNETHLSWMTRGTYEAGMVMVARFAGEHYVVLWDSGSELDRKYQLEEWQAGDLDWEMNVSEDVYAWAKRTANENGWKTEGMRIVRVGLHAMSLNQNDVVIDDVQSWCTK